MAEAGGAPVLVVAALAAEAGPLAARLGAGTPRRGEVVEARSGGIAVAVTGDGSRAADHGTRDALRIIRPRVVMALGLAGGLSPGLVAGDVIVGERILDGVEAIPLDRRWVDLARAEGALPATIVSSPDVLSTREAKRIAWETAGRPTPACVDLESAAVAQIAREAGIPCVVLRAISDTAHEDLPLDFNRCRDREGRIQSSRVLRRALVRPQSWTGLRRLRQRMAVCSEALAGVTARVLSLEAE